MTYLTAFIGLIGFALSALGFIDPALASGAEGDIHPEMGTIGIPPLHPAGLACIAIFVIAYSLVLLEEKIRLRKSKPVMLGAALIWIVIAIIAPSYNVDHAQLDYAIMHGLVEYGSLLLFLITAMTYINSLEDRNVFSALRCKLIKSHFSMRQLFWATGLLAFFMSPIADNLTTAMVLGTVVMSVGRHDQKFVVLAAINIVNAANAGGAFSPFGDITTLMVWQAGQVEFFEFFSLFIPCVVAFVVPAFVMSLFVSKDYPDALNEDIQMKFGAKRMIFFGVVTIALAVSLENFLGLPPFLGMMAGLSLLMMCGYHIRELSVSQKDRDFSVFRQIQGAEWDTLLFFYGVIFAVGGLTFLGYMELASNAMYNELGASVTNISVGVISAVIDNIPVMFAVLSMDPDMSQFQWLLVTLTAGIGGSLLSIGSAAGIAMMGIAHGEYTFMKHLKWTPLIAVGYIAAIGAHFLINGNIGAEAAPQSTIEQAEAHSTEKAAH
ncbi:MAG: sodium:proton antiporter NhaD [Alphaproteobacteria bacterium]